jgi:hypothetical protein
VVLPATLLFDVRPVGVRALALAAAPDELVRPRLEELLLDRRALLRRVAQDRGRRLGIDTADFYRARLPARTAILGLGETGTAADLEVLLPLPRDRAVVRAIGLLAPPDRTAVLMRPLLTADAPGVVREANRQLRRAGVALADDEIEELLESANPAARAAALGMAWRRRGWHGLIAALALLQDPDDRISSSARARVGRWLGFNAATAGAPSEPQRERLTRLLDLAPLHPSAVRAIEFHAGMR